MILWIGFMNKFPNDQYRGGYFYKNATGGGAFSRYLHIMALKSHVDDPKRYNYIVHPLAYRADLNNLPDASVDGIQLAILDTPFEEHFRESSECKCGDKVNAIEIFNDFT